MPHTQTPGPWRVHPGDSLTIIGADHCVVARANKPSGDMSGTAYADARLIAAAPAMRAACEYVAEFGGAALTQEQAETLAKRCRAALPSK